MRRGTRDVKLHPIKYGARFIKIPIMNGHKAAMKWHAMHEYAAGDKKHKSSNQILSMRAVCAFRD
jgi:hypothetical protein